MNDPMTILKADHREVKAMLQELADSKPGRSRTARVRELTQALSLHMEIEEALVYPLVRSEEGAEVEEEAQNEHVLARDGLTKAQEMVAEPGFGAVIAMLQAGITHHVKEEETEFFPATRKTDMDMEALGAKMAARKRELTAKLSTQPRRALH